MSLLSETTRQTLTDKYFGLYPDDAAAVDAVIAYTQDGAWRHGFVPYIDSIPRPSDEYIDTRIVIPEIEPDILTTEFGWESVIWAAANVREAHNASRHLNRMTELTGHKSAEVQKAIRWTQMQNHDSKLTCKAHDLLFQLGLQSCIGAVGNYDIPALIQDKAAVKLSRERASRYGLLPLATAHNQVDGRAVHPWKADKAVSYDIGFDGPVGLALTYRDRPIALASYGTFYNDAIGVMQIQGVTGKKIDTGGNYFPHGLDALDWRGLFVTVAEIAAQQTDASSVFIPSSERNKWIDRNPAAAAGRLSLQSAVRAYDEPARRHGYELGGDGMWRKDIA